MTYYIAKAYKDDALNLYERGYTQDAIFKILLALSEQMDLLTWQAVNEAKKSKDGK